MEDVQESEWESVRRPNQTKNFHLAKGACITNGQRIRLHGRLGMLVVSVELFDMSLARPIKSDPAGLPAYRSFIES